jgi:hypothetical protein
MISSERIAELKEQQRLWEEGILPDSMFEAFVLATLCGEDARQYELTDLLSDGAISLLLNNGEQQLKYEGKGGVSMFTSAGKVDTSYLAPQYRRVFEQWALRGWIEFGEENSVRRVQT